MLCAIFAHKVVVLRILNGAGQIIRPLDNLLWPAN